MLSSHKTEEATDYFSWALHVFSQIDPDSEAVAENHYCIAESLIDRGDNEDALSHSLKAKTMRERIYGTMHSKTIDSYQQLAKLLSMNYTVLEGAVTPNVEKDLQMAISCYENVFKYLKQRRRVLADSCARIDQQKHNSILLSVVRTIIGLKLKLVPVHLQARLRTIRSQPNQYTEKRLKDAVLLLVQLSPNVYLDDVLQRMDHQEAMAMAEFEMIVQIAESPVLQLV